MKDLPRVDLYEDKVLAEVDLVTGEIVVPLRGDPTLTDDGGPRRIARVLTRALDSPAPDDAPDVDYASRIHLQLPLAEIDSAELIDVDVEFFDGAQCSAVVVGPDAIPSTDLSALAVSVCRVMHEAADDVDLVSQVPSLLDAARDLKAVVLDPLNARIREVEDGVRAALNDERLSAEDFEALTRYGDRLALVEKLSAQLAEREPEWQRRPIKRSAFDLSLPLDTDFFSQWARNCGKAALEATTRLSTLLSSQSVIVARRQAQDTERFQRAVTLVGAAVLVPSLVAGAFGANVGLPARDSRDALWAMLLLMLSGGLASYGAVRLGETGTLRSVLSRLPEWAKPSPATTTMFVFAAAILAAAAAAVLLA